MDVWHVDVDSVLGRSFNVGRVVQEKQVGQHRAGRSVGGCITRVENGHCEEVGFFFSSRRRHTRLASDWSSDVCSSDLLNILVKYVRMYGFEHKRTEGQFEIAWNELQAAIPQAGDGGFLLGVSGSKLLIDGKIGRASCRERG